jgi:hypothetical protein
MDNALGWGEFELYFLIGKLRDYLPREIEFRDLVIEGKTERCIKLDDIEMLCRAILRAFADRAEVEGLSPLVPRAQMMLEEIERLKLDDTRD